MNRRHREVLMRRIRHLAERITGAALDRKDLQYDRAELSALVTVMVMNANHVSRGR